MAIRVFLWTFFVLSFLKLTEVKAGPEVLDSLIEIALKDNAGLIAAQSRYQAMRSEAGAAGALPDPSFTISAMNLPKSTLSLLEMDMSGISLGASQTIPWPGTLFAKARAARLSAEVEMADVKSLKNSIIRQIKHYYNEYSYWSFAENLISENIAISGQVIDFIETRYSNGTGSIEEVISARISKNEMENMRLDVQAEKRAALYMVKQLVNDSNVTDTSLMPFMSFTMDEIPLELPDYSRNPGLAGAATKYEVARARHSLAKSEYWPEFMIGADYLIRYSDSLSALSDHIAFPGEDMWSFHFGFTLPLWFFSKQKKMTTATRYEMEAAQAEEEALNIELRHSVHEAQTRVQVLRQRTRHYVESIIPLTDAAFKAAYVAYETGQIDFQKLLEDQMEVYLAKLEHLKLVKEYQQTRAYLDELIGEKLEVKNENNAPATTH